MRARPHIQERCQRISSGNPIKDRSKWYEITAYEYLNKALDIKLKHFEADHIALVSIYECFGNLYYDKNNFQKAM